MWIAKKVYRDVKRSYGTTKKRKYTRDYKTVEEQQITRDGPNMSRLKIEATTTTKIPNALFKKLQPKEKVLNKQKEDVIIKLLTQEDLRLREK